MPRSARLLAKRIVGLLPEAVAWQAFDSIRLLTNPAARRRRERAAAIQHQLGLPQVVQSGTFAGMAYGKCIGQGELLPKLLGTYEKELTPVWQALVAAPPDLVIDIGAAEGFYAVGLARLLQRTVIAFELEPPYHAAIRALARSNGVADHVHVLGECTSATLDRELTRGAQPFVLSDCEGAEAILLDPLKAPELRRARILVELHERLVPGVTPLVLGRFALTHTAQLITTIPRSPADLPARAALETDDAQFAMDEGRGGPMQWALLEPCVPRE